MRPIIITPFVIAAGLFFGNAALLLADLVLRPAEGFRLGVTLAATMVYAAPGVLIAAIGLNLNALLKLHQEANDPARRLSRLLTRRLGMLLSCGAAGLALILMVSLSAILHRMGEGVGVFG